MNHTLCHVPYALPHVCAIKHAMHVVDIIAFIYCSLTLLMRYIACHEHLPKNHTTVLLQMPNLSVVAMLHTYLQSTSTVESACQFLDAKKHTTTGIFK